MNKHISTFLSILFFSISLNAQVGNLFSDCTLGSNMGNVTVALEHLGNIPLYQGMDNKELNIWDLQKFQGRIYIGYGSTATNAGPIQLWSIDTENDFKYETTVRGEVIQKFRVYNNTLYVPNGDPKEDITKLMSKSSEGEWEEHRWTPDLAHVRDMILFEDKFYLLGNSRHPSIPKPKFSGIQVADIAFENITAELLSDSIANHITELDQIVNPNIPLINPINPNYNWFFGGFIFNDTLVLPNAFLRAQYDKEEELYEGATYFVTNNQIQWSGNLPSEEQIKPRHLYPVKYNQASSIANNIENNTILRPVESIEYKGKLLITYRTNSYVQEYYQEAYSNSAGMVCKSYLKEDAEFITFPDGNSIGEDMLIIKNELYALSNTKLDSATFMTYIYKTNDPSVQPEHWEEVLSFQSSNLTRSFEFLNGYFYFGMGLNSNDEGSSSGNLMRVKTNCQIDECTQFGSPCDDGDICTADDRYDSDCNCEGTLIDNDGNGDCDIFECADYLYISEPVRSIFTQFSAEKEVVCDAIIDSPFPVELNAGESVVLEKGFTLKPNTILSVEIKSCQ